MSKKLIIFILTVFITTFAIAQETKNFEVPLPGNSSFIEAKDLIMSGRPIQVSLYQSSDDPEKIIDFYANYFEGQEFKKTVDKEDPKKGIHRLRFKKDDLVVSIAVRPSGGNTELVIAKYTQQPGEPEPEDAKPSVKDTLLALPKKDVAGFDLSQVPRPPDSIRMMSTKSGKIAILLYMTSLSVEESVSFYKETLDFEGWEIQNEQAAKDGVEAFEKNTKRKSIGISSPFSDGEDLETVIKESYVLTFKNKDSNLRIVIFPNLFDRKLGAFVQINLR